MKFIYREMNTDTLDPTSLPLKNNLKKPDLLKSKTWLFFISLPILLLVLFGWAFSAPRNFPKNSILSVQNGQSLKQISESLENQGFIKSPLALQFFVILYGGQKRILAGDYFVTEKLPVFKVASMILENSGALRIKVTLPEGLTIAQMAKIFSEKMPGFEESKFAKLAKGQEGYLFPDTYFFFRNTTEEDIFKTLSKNFNSKTESLQKETTTSNRNFKETVVMASLLEKEASNAEDKRIISGILWKRIKLDIPLQVDSVFLYLLNKSSSDLTLDDLKLDSPYNTYLHRGLPSAPIGNPGLNSIEAALYPKASDYLYYLHDKDGLVHYARSFEEHKANKQKFLK